MVSALVVKAFLSFSSTVLFKFGENNSINVVFLLCLDRWNDTRIQECQPSSDKQNALLTNYNRTIRDTKAAR